MRADAARCAAVLRLGLTLDGRAALTSLLLDDLIADDLPAIRDGDHKRLDEVFERFYNTRYPSTP